MKEPLRLRVLDINTPWFWFTIFYEPFVYGDSWLRIEFWHPHTWRKWWFHYWMWEQLPDTRGLEAESLNKREQDV